MALRKAQRLDSANIKVLNELVNIFRCLNHPPLEAISETKTRKSISLIMTMRRTGSGKSTERRRRTDNWKSE